MEEFFHADSHNNIVHPGRHIHPGKMEGSGRTGAGVLRIDDRNAADLHIPENHLTAYALLPGNQSSHGIANRDSFQGAFLDVGALQGAFHCFTSEIFHAAVDMFGKASHARADNGDLSHGAVPPWDKNALI
jgi:hypothetical protein